jgi:exopolysaccharide production protein ExoQ
MNSSRRLVVFILLLMSTGAVSGVYVAQQAATARTATGGDVLLQVLFGLLYLIIGAWLFPRFKEVFSLLYEERWMLLLLLFAFASTAWSVEPGETFRRSLGLAGTIMAGLFIGMHYEPKQLIRVLALCIGIGALASLFVGLVFPSVGIMPDGQWQGVFNLKNSLGRMMALGVVCFAFLGIGQRRFRFVSISMILLCGILLLLAKSATGIVVCFMVLALLPFRSILNRSKRGLMAAAVLLIIAAVPAAIWSWINRDQILSLLGRESTLTGRLPLWHLVKAQILLQPKFGVGYAAFWTSAQADRYREILRWDAPNAHNGFLEMTLGLGVVGLAIFAFGMLRNFFRGISIARHSGEIEMAWPLCFVIFCFLYNLTESTLFTGNTAFWMLYAANSFWMVRALAASRVSEAEQFEPESTPGELAHAVIAD